jgi:hypothetical protein
VAHLGGIRAGCRVLLARADDRSEEDKHRGSRIGGAGCFLMAVKWGQTEEEHTTAQWVEANKVRSSRRERAQRDGEDDRCLHRERIR